MLNVLLQYLGKLENKKNGTDFNSIHYKLLVSPRHFISLNT